VGLPPGSRNSQDQSASSHRIDLGCVFQHGAFEQLYIRSLEFPSPHIQISDPDESLIFFMRSLPASGLLDRLRAMGTASPPS